MTGKATPHVRLGALKQWRDSSPPESSQRKLTDYQLKRIADSDARDLAGVQKVASTSGNRLVEECAPAIAEALLAAEQPHAPVAPPPVKSGPPEAKDFAEVAVEGLETPDVVPNVRSEAVEGGVLLTWPTRRPSGPAGLSGPSREYRVFRVVSGRNSNPVPPGFGELVGIVEENRLLDASSFAFAARYYSIWANTGPTKESALSGQPALVAYGDVVSPVQDWSIRQSDGLVTGRWSVPPGAHSVVVHRHSLDEPISPNNRLRNANRPDDPQLGGFEDRTGRPLQPYVYSVYVMAEVNGVKKASAQVSQQLTIPAVPQQVTDLTVDQRTDEGGKVVFDVSWSSPPVGKVEIYLTQEEPDPELALEPRQADALDTSVLLPSSKIDNVQVPQGDRVHISGVPWRQTWFRAYLTPVTWAGDLVQVGEPRAFARMEPVRDAELRERVDTQVIVFDWPDGAAQVAAYVTLPGAPWEGPGNSRPFGQIGRADYDHLGGLTLQLDGKAFDIHLVPQAWDRGALESGRGLTLHYPGLVRLKYRFHQEMTAEGFRGRRQVPKGPMVVQVMSDSDLSAGVFFSLVHNPERLPLSPRDGQTLSTVTSPLRKNVETPILEKPPARPGFIRLFAEAKNASPPLALLDPDVGRLRT